MLNSEYSLYLHIYIYIPSKNHKIAYIQYTYNMKKIIPLKKPKFCTNNNKNELEIKKHLKMIREILSLFPMSFMKIRDFVF